MRDTKGFARNSFRKYWCNFLGQQRVIIGESEGGGERERECRAREGAAEGEQDEKGNRHKAGKEERKRERRDEGGRGKRGRKERNVAVDKGVSIAVSAASMIRASYNESRGE